MGKVLEINPMSLNSGPGFRVEVILSSNDEGVLLTPNQLVDRIRKFRPYIELNNGGVTFKGDNIFLQSNYIDEVSHICHKAGIPACIMCNANNYNGEDISKHIDFVILSITGLPVYNYNNLTDTEFNNIDKFIKQVCNKNIPIYINQEIIKGKNDNKEYIKELKKYLKVYQNIKQIDIIGNIEEESLDELRKVLNEV
jgi:pyruvate formate lyase activating enzyme